MDLDLLQRTSIIQSTYYKVQKFCVSRNLDTDLLHCVVIKESRQLNLSIKNELFKI
jgi:hypothetical protein